jgi:hypothetical protein
MLRATRFALGVIVVVSALRASHNGDDRRPWFGEPRQSLYRPSRPEQPEASPLGLSSQKTSSLVPEEPRSMSSGCGRDARHLRSGGTSQRLCDGRGGDASLGTRHEWLVWHEIQFVWRFPLKDSASGCVFLSGGHPGKEPDPDGLSVRFQSFPHDA